MDLSSLLACLGIFGLLHLCHASCLKKKCQNPEEDGIAIWIFYGKAFLHVIFT